MKRKKFLLLSAVAVSAIAVPVVQCKRPDRGRDKPMEQPGVLGQFCSEEEVRAIGKKYRSLTPDEDKKELLTELLLTADSGKKVTGTSNSAISDWIDQKIEKDFKEGKTLITNGWVISITEARQCALFSIT